MPIYDTPMPKVGGGSLISIKYVCIPLRNISEAQGIAPEGWHIPTINNII